MFRITFFHNGERFTVRDVIALSLAEARRKCLSQIAGMTGLTVAQAKLLSWGGKQTHRQCGTGFISVDSSFRLRANR